jgi:hypothetical protein
MFIKNSAGKDAVWEAQQRGNEELVGWMLGFGEEQVVGETTEEDAIEAENIQIEHNVETENVENGNVDGESINKAS